MYVHKCSPEAPGILTAFSLFFSRTRAGDPGFTAPVALNVLETMTCDFFSCAGDNEVNFTNTARDEAGSFLSRDWLQLSSAQSHAGGERECTIFFTWI